MVNNLRRQTIFALASGRGILPWARPALAAVRPLSFTHAKALVDRYIAEKKIANAVIVLGGRTAPPVTYHAGSLSFEGRAPADSNSLYRLYSMTKPITGMAAMLLVEAGKLSLDQPLADLFPAFSHMSVLINPANGLDARPADKPILIRHLLTHSAGLTYSIMPKSPLQQAYLERGIVTGQVSPQDEATMHRPATLAALADSVAGLPLLCEPGSQWNYSIGLDIVGAVIERVAGTGFDHFLQERIFGPLRMFDTGFQVPVSKLNRLCTNYEIHDGKAQASDVPPNSIFARKPALFYGGAGLVSSAHDYARFDAMLLNEGKLDDVRIMKAGTARIAMSNLLDPGVTTPDGQGFGAGGRCVIKAVPDGFALGAYGWDGAFGTVSFVDRESGFCALMMTQIPNRAYPLPHEFVTAAYADWRS